MTTHEVGAFIHIHSNSSKTITYTCDVHSVIIILYLSASSRGTLYTSDSTGEYYTVSLENHLVSVGYLQSLYTYYVCVYMCMYSIYMYAYYVCMFIVHDTVCVLFSI